MTLVLTNEEVEDLLDMPGCIAALESAPHNYLAGLGDVAVRSHDPVHLLAKVRDGTVAPHDLGPGIASSHPPASEPELTDIVAGKAPGRTADEEITAFVNNIGLGIQFAALGALAYRRARERRVGREIPTEWFLQDVHP